MFQWIDGLARHVSLAPAAHERFALSLVVVVGLWFARRWVVRVALSRTDDPRTRYQRKKTVSHLFFISSGLLLAGIWLSDLATMATYLGLLSAGLAIALKDPVTNAFAWLFIVWRRPFEVGDRVQIEDHSGDVIDLRVFEFTLMEIGNWVAAEQSTGRVVHIPNSRVFTAAVANYSKGFQYIWNEIGVLVTFESSWQKAKRVLLEIAEHRAAKLSPDAEQRVRKAAERFLIMYGTLTPTVYTRVEASGVLLTVRYLCRPHERRSSEHAIWEDILAEFARHGDIEFAYPTQRFYDALAESRRPRSPEGGAPGAPGVTPEA